MNSARWIVGTIAAVVSFGASNLVADKIAALQCIGEGSFTIKGTFADFTNKYYAGDYVGIDNALRQLHDTTVDVDCTGRKIKPLQAFDFEHNYYSFAFVAKKPQDFTRNVVRVLTYSNGFVSKYESAGAVNIDLGDTMLPGEKTFYDVFLTDDPHASLGTTISYVEVENPFFTDVLKLAKMISFGDLAAVIAKDERRGMLAPAVQEAPQETAVYFRLSRVMVPARRATVTVSSALHDATTEPPNGTAVKSTITYSNAPLRRFSAGIVAAGMFTHNLDGRMTITNGAIATDPLNGTVSIAAFYIHPSNYIGETGHPSCAERRKLLIGYVVTPAPGLALGGAVLPFRGLTINLGYAFMLVNTLKEGSHVGDPVTEANPLRRGVSGSVFLGLGYNFN